MPIRAIISDITLTGHPENVRTAFLEGYGSGLTVDDVMITQDETTDLIQDGNDYVTMGNCTIAVIRSTSGILEYSNIIQADGFTDARWKLFMPLGSNSYEELTALTSISPYAIATGAGVNTNETGYGNGLEFWDYDLDIVDPDLSSYSNGRIAGKMLKIVDTLNCTWDEARQRARLTASNNGIWNKFNGYGNINVDAAIAFVFSPEVNPSTTMTVRNAFDTMILNATVETRNYLNSLLTAKSTGKGGYLWSEFLRIYLSGREDKNDYYAITPDVAQIQAWTVPIHKKRGTKQGIIEDVHRICNAEAECRINFFPQSECGWIVDVTAPEFIRDETYSPTDSPCYLDLDNLIEILAPNYGNRSNKEIEYILRHDVIPAKYNLRASISKILGIPSNPI